MSRYIVALTGASGVIYGLTLIAELIKRNHEVHLIVSDPAHLVLEQEMGWKIDKPIETAIKEYMPEGSLYFHKNSDIGAKIASGSFLTEAMVVIPCTMSTLASVANGMSNNLIERASDVMLKENRPLILVPRETPLSIIHLRNMLKAAEAGAVIIPAMPAFYHNPESISEMVMFIVGKVLDIMRIPHDIFRRYTGGNAD